LIALPLIACLAALLIWGVADISGFGHYRGPYGNILNKVAVPERHTTNVVGATVFDYRAIDTLGEEFILFGAVVGVVLLLRSSGATAEEADDDEDVVDAEGSTPLRVVGWALVGVALLLGLWLAAFGLITPGGGFQAGVLLAGAIVLVYAALSYRSWRKLSNEHLVDPFEGFGVGAFVAIGLAAVVAGLPFLHNLFGPGTRGTLLSGGSMPLLNWATAIEVAAANVVLFSEFLLRHVVGRKKA